MIKGEPQAQGDMKYCRGIREIFLLEHLLKFTRNLWYLHSYIKRKHKVRSSLF